MVGNNCNKAGETVWERFDWPPMGKRGWEDADEARIHNINSSWAAQSGTGNHMVYQRHQRCSRSNGTKKCRQAQKHPSGRQTGPPTLQDDVIKRRHWSVKEVVFWRLSNGSIYIRGVVTF